MVKNSSAASPPGRRLLELYAALFILLGPTVIGQGKGFGLYGLFAAEVIVFGARIIETKKIHISLNIILWAAMGVYSALTLLWAESLYAHGRFVVTALTVVLGMLLMADYLCGQKEKRVKNRLLWLVAVSGALCAVWNILYWAAVRRFSIAEGFCAGMGSSDLLGGYMLAGIACCWQLVSRKRANLRPALCMCVPMIFTAVMTRSLTAACFGGAWLLMAAKRRGRRLLPLKASAAISTVLVLGSSLIRLDRPFADALISGFRNVVGLGGGGFLSRQGELQTGAYLVDSIGIGAELISALGLVGMLLLLLFVGRSLYMVYKRRSALWGLVLLLTAFIFLSPAPNCPAALVLLMGLSVYGEWRDGKTATVYVGGLSRAVCVLLGAAAVYSVVWGAGDCFRISGLKRVDEDPYTAVQDFVTASKVNPADGQSSYLAARTYKAIYTKSDLKNDIANAERYIKLAMEREAHNAVFCGEYAAILASEGNYSAAIDADRRAMELAPLRDEFRVQAAEHLFANIQTMTKGSYEAQECHRLILEIGEKAVDIEQKKLINDIADKAQPYTRVEIPEDEQAE